MPRAYAKVLTAIWKDPDFVALPSAAQRLYQLLLSQQDLSLCGLIHVRVRPWSKLAPDTNPEDIADALRTLCERRYVCVDEDTEEALIRTLIRHDGGINNRNIHKGIENSIALIQSVRLQTIAKDELAKAAGHTPCEDPPDGKRSPFEDPPKTHANPSSQQPEASSHPPAASSRAGRHDETGPPDDLPPAAAAAVEILIAHRALTAKEPIDNPARYARKIRLNLDTTERQALIAEHEAGTEPEIIARRVFNLTKWQTTAALTHLARQVTA